MNFNIIGTVIGREYTTRVKKKSFLVTTFLVPVLFAALCCIPALIVLFNKDEVKTIAVIDDSAMVLDSLKDNSRAVYVNCTGQNIESLKSDIEDNPYDAVLYISPLSDAKSVSVSTYSKKPVGDAVISDIENTINQVILDYRIEQYNITGLKSILDEVKPEIEVKTYTIDEDGKDKISNNDVFKVVSILLGMVIFIFVTMFSASVMASVVEEKQSKVVEVLLSSVDSLDLMFGKIVGVAMVALTQFVMWIVVTAVLVSAIFGVIGKDKLNMSKEDTVAMVENISPAGAEVQGMIPATDSVPAEADGLQTVLSTLGQIDLTALLVCFFVFFVFGYLLYASMFAAIGSAVESTEDSNSLQVPLTIPLMIAYFIAIYCWNAPDSTLAVLGSMIPFTSPIVMLTRIPFGVPTWQIILSLAILVATFFVMAWLSAKIYRVGILTSGKKATWKDIFKWLRQN